LGKGSEAAFDPVVGQEEEGNAICGGKTLLKVEKATAISELRTIHNPLSHCDSDTPVA
jgi:hypothetical protein